MGFKCIECAFIFSGILDLNSHIETQHNKSDDVIKTAVMDECVKCGKIIRTNTKSTQICTMKHVMNVKHQKQDLFGCYFVQFILSFNTHFSQQDYYNDRTDKTITCLPFAS